MPECWPQSWDAASDRRQAIGDERHKAPASRAVLRELRGGNTQGRAAHLQLSERGVSHWALVQKRLCGNSHSKTVKFELGEGELGSKTSGMGNTHPAKTVKESNLVSRSFASSEALPSKTCRRRV